ncbi:hypothetical protein Y1Q_0000662 [Alligator mississippiensis]|uniref:Uncharacterized protein n=1 Tax=Alligator mississippiensis TaxID=8496 RepID=A0A151MC35_ALLMI|nr:hypothetical protein Y1Q_0000662 [Alligator mississippiensis]
MGEEGLVPPPSIAGGWSQVTSEDGHPEKMHGFILLLGCKQSSHGWQWKEETGTVAVEQIKINWEWIKPQIHWGRVFNHSKASTNRRCNQSLE